MGDAATARLTERLRGELGAERGRLRDWEARAGRLREYVAEPGREPVRSYGAVREFLEVEWGLPVVELREAVAEAGPLDGQVSDRGRCGVRLLDLFGATEVYLVVRRGPGDGEADALWTLLHELGHLACHFELLQSVSAAYQRLCVNPPLESAIGEFAQRSGTALRAALELEADLFALDWLLPRWPGDEAPGGVGTLAEVGAPGAVRALEGTGAPGGGPGDVGLTRDGRLFLQLRAAFGRGLGTSELSAALVERLDRAGAEEAARAAGPLAAGSTRWGRLAWLLWNRGRYDPTADVAARLEEYYEVIGPRTRYVPEFNRPVTTRGGFDPATAWLPRVGVGGAEAAVERAGWLPLLVAADGSRYPLYNVPIRPLPSANLDDTAVPWVHMMKRFSQRPLPLGAWVERVVGEDAGLLLFPRNPGERALDGRGEARP